MCIRMVKQSYHALLVNPIISSTTNNRTAKRNSASSYGIVKEKAETLKKWEVSRGLMAKVCSDKLNRRRSNHGHKKSITYS